MSRNSQSWWQMAPFCLLLSVLSLSARAGDPVQISLDSVTVFNDDIAEVALEVSGNQISRGLQLRLDFDPTNIVAVDVDDCLAGFVGEGQLGTLCSQPDGQPGRVRILLNAGAGQAINSFGGTLRFQLDGTLPADSVIELQWHEEFAFASNPAAPTALQDGQIIIAGPPPGELALDPTSIDFGAIEFGLSTTAVVNLMNVAPVDAQDIEIVSLSVSGDPGFSLTEGGTCQVGTVLAPQGSGCTAELSFEPSGAGEFDGALNVGTIDLQSETAALVGQGLPAPATIILGDLIQVYTGEPLTPTVSTEPPGLNVALTYDDLSDPPVDAGSYEVAATIVEGNYTGTVVEEFIILAAEIHQDRFEQDFRTDGE